MPKEAATPGSPDVAYGADPGRPAHDGHSRGLEHVPLDRAGLGLLQSEEVAEEPAARLVYEAELEVVDVEGQRRCVAGGDGLAGHSAPESDDGSDHQRWHGRLDARCLVGRRQYLSHAGEVDGHRGRALR